ncbi:Bgt-20604 [Blumeria graminis f. sp. tritici]|uniref:Bgt-20604 n=2 Tax=Blumeria graminis f. sp. tritici TaxID=62690 RepID=A0A9X9QDW3_BLUGR|nr:Bgt-20604 [Blumeria graminis f. sp. tritici]
MPTNVPKMKPRRNCHSQYGLQRLTLPLDPHLSRLSSLKLFVPLEQQSPHKPGP